MRFTENVNVLIIDDDNVFSSMIGEALKLEGLDVKVVNSFEAGLAEIKKKNFKLGLFDIDLKSEKEIQNGFALLNKVKSIDSEIHVILMSTMDDNKTIIKAMNEGASDFLSKSNSLEEIIQRVIGISENINYKNENKILKIILNENHKGYDIVTANKNILDTLDKLESLGESPDINIFIEGENGTGKELIARFAHDRASHNSHRPFIAVNCAAIPENLLESTLFGHVKGAFTGANEDKIGKFELANGGDIFLDEIGTLPESLQAKLLRVIQEKEIERIGSNKTTKVKFRVISATNENMQKLVANGKFRSDLYFRLKGFKVELPPLRERKEDIEILIEKFSSKVMKNSKIVKFSKEAMSIILNHTWPGNIRELKSVIELAIALKREGVITPRDLPINFNIESHGSSQKAVAGGTCDSNFGGIEKIKEIGLTSYLLSIEKSLIEEAIKNTKTQAKAAELLKIPASTLTRKIKELEIEVL